MESGNNVDASRRSTSRLIRIELTGQRSDEDLHSLSAWLGNAPKVRQHALISMVGAPPEPGRMGGTLFEVVQLLADVTLQTASLVIAIMSWRAAVRSESRIVIIREDGRSVPVPDGDPDPETAEQVVRDVESTD